MSNHHHIVLTDVKGVLPDFARELHRTAAKALNASQGQWENLWSAEQYHRLELGDDEDIIDKIAYLAANPVEAGLVKTPLEWPGVMLLPGPAATKLHTVKRPPVYFSDWEPDELTLAIAHPVWKTPQQAWSLLADAIENATNRAIENVRAAGRSFLGAERVLSTSPIHQAVSHEIRRDPIPRIRARNFDLWKALVAAYQAFRMDYAEAMDWWRKGLRTIVFPAGTWHMRVFHRCEVAAVRSG